MNTLSILIFVLAIGGQLVAAVDLSGLDFYETPEQNLYEDGPLRNPGLWISFCGNGRVVLNFNMGWNCINNDNILRTGTYTFAQENGFSNSMLIIELENQKIALNLEVDVERSEFFITEPLHEISFASKTR